MCFGRIIIKWDSFATAVVGHNQGTVTQADLSVGAYTTNAATADEVVDMVALQTAASDANSVFYSGTSYFPLGLGQVFTIINQTIEHELIVIEAEHRSEVHGNYTCAFKAIPSDVAAPPYTDVSCYAKADSQPAKVIDNNDPDGLGRVKVQFNWAGASAKSDWMRMIQPHSGSGKGFYFIPEVDEEVLVGFEGNNAQNPYVLGSQYNGSESSGYADGENNVKAIHTRSGTKIIMNDSEGSILIEDPSGNTWMMDGQGNISVNAPKNFTLNAGGNISMTAGQNISTSATMNISESAGVNHSSSAGGMMIKNAGLDYQLKAANIMEIAQGARSSKAKEITEISKISENNTEGKMIFNAKDTIHHKSGEKSKIH